LAANLGKRTVNTVSISSDRTAISPPWAIAICWAIYRPRPRLPSLSELPAASRPRTKDQVDELDRELKSAGARYKIVTYPGVKHSFTNPAAREYGGKQFDMPGDEYNADADQRSWNAILEFLERVMK
jgi:dienelactone hydrolase